MNKLTLQAQDGPQKNFIQTPADIAIYGGAAQSEAAKLTDFYLNRFDMSQIQNLKALYFAGH